MGGRPALRFLGAAGTVTGSMFLVTGAGGAVLVDCGLFQGQRQWRRLNWSQSRVLPDDVDDVVLTHGHLDRCGYLPALVHRGWAGPVWATEGTRALAEILLLDSAHLQEEDALHAQREGYSRHSQPQPRYLGTDVQRTMPLFRPTAYGAPTRLSSGAVLTLHRAGHVLGSASARLEVDGCTVLFSGDLGRPHHPLLRPREAPPGVDTVVIESTYGNRNHPDDGDHEVLADAVRRTVHRGGSVLVPTFAVDRTELVLLTLARSCRPVASHRSRCSSTARWPWRRWRRRPVRTSPTSSCSAPSTRSPGSRGCTPPGPRGVGQAQQPGRAEHRRLGLGRCQRGWGGAPPAHDAARPRQHGGPHRLPDLRDPRSRPAGRRERGQDDGPVRAGPPEVVTDAGFSVHADCDELVAWLSEMPVPPRTVYVVHGDPDASGALADRVRAALDCVVVVPEMGERVLLC